MPLVGRANSLELFTVAGQKVSDGSPTLAAHKLDDYTNETPAFYCVELLHTGLAWRGGCKVQCTTHDRWCKSARTMAAAPPEAGAQIQWES